LVISKLALLCKMAADKQLVVALAADEMAAQSAQD
jgi:hypothetical protein